MSDEQLQPSAAGTRSRLNTFVRRRLSEASYGLVFATLFLAAQSPLNALVVDDIRVLSRLGEPFLAEIAVTPAAGEMLSRGCFTTRNASGDLPAPTNLRLALTRRLDAAVLTLRGATMREPMSEFVLQVKCPGVPTLMRTYLVMVDPPVYRESPARVAQSGAAAAATPAAITGRPVPAAPQPRARRAVAVAAPIAPGSRYKVRVGDTLSTIAARVAGRPDWSVWPIAQHIFAANPGAFLLGNPNVIAEGATIAIPHLDEVDTSKAPGRLALAATPTRSAAQNSTPGRAVAAEAAPRPASALTPAPAARTASSTRPASSVPAAAQPATTIAAPVAPAVQRAVAPAVPLPAMQLTTVLFGESQMKLRLRRQGLPVAPVVTRAPAVQRQAPVAPAPQSRPEPPSVATTAERAALPPSASTSPGLMGWARWILGLLIAFALGALASALLLRRRKNEHIEIEPAPRAAPAPAPTIAVAAPVVTAAAPVTEPQPAPPTPAVAVEPEPETSDTQELAFDLSDHELGLEFTEGSTLRSHTLEMPNIEGALDFELPEASESQTGQHDVDFELLERVYSEAYETELSDDDEQATSEMPLLGEDELGTETGDQRYYHLENRDPADEAPLAIELGDDEASGSDPAADGKVVSFPKSSSSG